MICLLLQAPGEVDDEAYLHLHADKVVLARMASAFAERPPDTAAVVQLLTGPR
jgi:hypothetical protein